MDVIHDSDIKNCDGKDFFSSAPFIGISRHRLLTDGTGVTSLVAFHGCPLSCKYCLNPQCKREEGVWMYLTPLQLYNRIKVDDIYFQSTGGGIVFGGGEPLLYPDFIKQFYELCKDDKWKICLETSLNVSRNVLYDLLPLIDEFIVDIKDMNPVIYRQYTGKDNKRVIDNLHYLKECDAEYKVLIRIPAIDGYNTDLDVEQTIDKLSRLGFQNYERIKYFTNPKEKHPTSDGQPVGKAICDVLKGIRLLIAEANEIDYSPNICHFEGDCLGTCPKCEKELELLTAVLDERKSKGAAIYL